MNSSGAHPTPPRAPPQPALLCSPGHSGPWKQMPRPPGLPGQEGAPLTLTWPTRFLAECCGRRHPCGGPPWNPGLSLHCVCMAHGRVGTGTAHTLTLAPIPTGSQRKGDQQSRASLARTRGQLWAHSAGLPCGSRCSRRQPTPTPELRDAACQIFIDILSQPACPSPTPSLWARAPRPAPPEGQASQGRGCSRGQ